MCRLLLLPGKPAMALRLGAGADLPGRESEAARAMPKKGPSRRPCRLEDVKSVSGEPVEPRTTNGRTFDSNSAHESRARRPRARVRHLGDIIFTQHFVLTDTPERYNLCAFDIKYQ